MKTLVRGTIAGLAGTLVMSGLMAAAKAAGIMREAPPKEITNRAGHKADVKQAKKGRQDFTPTWVAAHLSFGAACGVAYTLLRPVIPGNGLVRGLLFGETVWATSYLKVLPEMGLYPAPQNDSNSRVAVMIAAHAFYGASLAATEEQLR